MQIVIRNYLSGSFLLDQEPGAWDSIVILDSRMTEPSFVKENSRRHLFLKFDDIIKITQGRQTVTADDISSALQFAEKSKQLMVCCRAGQSRSAAIAFTIAFQLLGATSALSLWNAKRHSPNALILDTASRLLDNPDFDDTYMKWFRDNTGISLTDYLDEIEQEYDQLEALGARNRISR